MAVYVKRCEASSVKPSTHREGSASILTTLNSIIDESSKSSFLSNALLATTPAITSPPLPPFPNPYHLGSIVAEVSSPSQWMLTPPTSLLSSPSNREMCSGVVRRVVRFSSVTGRVKLCSIRNSGSDVGGESSEVNGSSKVGR